MMKLWHLYLVRSRQGEIYTGISTDIGRRFAEHQAGRGSRYLAGRRPLVLELCIPIGERSLALRLERLVKRLSRSAKEDLIKGEIALADLQAMLSPVSKKRGHETAD